jgi:hypothetical protein
MYVFEVQEMTWALEAESYADGCRSNPYGVGKVGDKERERERETKCSAVTGNFVGRH